MMKAEIKLEVCHTDISHELESLVESTCKDEITKLSKTHADKMVKEEVGKILKPLVMSVLTNSSFKVASAYGSHRNSVDAQIKKLMISYMDEPVFLYSKDSDKISHRYHTSDGGHRSRLESYLEFAMKRYFEEHIEEKMKEYVAKYIQSKEELEAIAKAQMQELLK